MRAEWQAHIDELLQEYQRKRAELKELQKTMSSVGATVMTADGMIKVEVGPQGRLVGLEFNPRVYRKLSPSELAEAVLGAVGEASGQVGDQMRAALEPLMPDGTSYDDAVKAGVDLSGVLPERPDDIDELKERYGFLDK